MVPSNKKFKTWTFDTNWFDKDGSGGGRAKFPLK
jgi:hypothetical protein